MEEIKISYYRSGVRGKHAAVKPLDGYLRQIYSGAFEDEVSQIRQTLDKKQRTALKANLPCVRYNLMQPGQTTDSGIESFSGLVYLDFDAPELASAGLNPELLIADLSAHDCVIAAYRSCSGMGVTCLVLVDGITSDAHYRQAFSELSEMFAVYCETDKAAINPSRANFVSFDPQMFRNEAPSPYILEAVKQQKENKFNEMVANVKKAYNPTEQDFFYQLLEHCKTNKVAITESYSDWLRMGFAIVKVFGKEEKALELFHEFSSLSSKYAPYDTEQKFRQICSTSENKVSITALIRDAQKYGFRYDYQSHKQSIRNLSIAEYHSVLKAIKIGVSLKETLSEFAEDDKKETVMWLYEKYNWIFNSYYEKINEKTGEVKLILHRLPLEVATKYVHQHHKPRWSVVNGYEILVEGSYEICRTAHENMIQYYLATKGIAFNEVHKAIYQQGKFDKYEPLNDYFDTITTVFTHEESRINAEGFLEILRTHNRVDFEKLTFEEMKAGVLVWGVYAVAMAMIEGSRVNDSLLGFVSITQGTGKTMFVNAMKRPFEKLNMAGDAREAYNLERDGKRKMMKNFILFDDEDVGRNKQEVENIKKCLSLQEIEFVEKYDKQDTRGKRISSFIFSSNNTAFLKEKSRREMIIPFVENIEYDTLQYHKDLSNDTLVNGFWAFCWYEATHNMQNYERKAQDLQKMKVQKNEEYMAPSIEMDLINACFDKPESTKGGLRKGNYHALGLTEVKIYLEAYYERLYSKMSNSEAMAGNYQNNSIKVDEYKLKRALNNAGFEYASTNVKGKTERCYRVKLKALSVDNADYIKNRFIDNDFVRNQKAWEYLDIDGNAIVTNNPEHPNYMPL